MGLKIFGPGGIDQKSNHLLRDPRKLRDSRNIKINSHLEYVKRDGRIQNPDFAPNVYNDVIYSRYSDEYIHRKSGEYYAINNETGEERQIYKFADPCTSDDKLISHAEYLNTVLFTHEKDQVFTAKYDGNAIYKAGLPTPIISGLSGGSKFGVFFYTFIDARGNVLYGPSVIKKNISQTGSFSVETFNTNGFCGSFLEIPKEVLPATATIINQSNRTITYSDASADLLVEGAKVVFKTSVVSGITIINNELGETPLGLFFKILEVESVNTTSKTITFTSESISFYTIVMSAPIGTTTDYNVCGQLSIYYYFSDSELTGYYGLSGDQYYAIINNSTTPINDVVSSSQTVAIDTSINTSVLLSDVYDITTSKLRPPKCKYICAFGDQIVCGGVLSFYDFENKETSYTNNDLVMYSDISNGDLGENFSEINRQLIGDTYDGQISGLVRFKDSMIVFKDTSIYSLDGVLTPGQYGLRRIESNEIGCPSFKSIIAVDKYVLFQGQDGVYSLNGYKAEKITTLLDPFFSSVDPSLTRAVVYNKDDQYLFNTNMGMVVVDYEYNELFIWDNIANCKGLIVDKNRELRMFDATRCLINQSLKNDLGTTAINAYIETAWFDLKEPSLLKKATDLRIFSLNNAGQVLTFRTYRDWDTTKVKGPFLIDMSSASTKTVLRKLDIEQAQSISIKIENNIVNEDMNISGYELLIDVIQSKDKNVK